MRLLPIALLLTAACGGRQIQNLPLTWRGVNDLPAPSASVAQSFATAPIAFGLRDVRPDPSAVGTYEDNGFVVRTSDNVAEFCAARMGEMLARAGARLHEAPVTILEAELVEYRVVEGGTFNGLVRIRAIVRHDGGNAAWSKTYVGKSRRWGRSHSPENFNEALSNALADAATQLVGDDEFAQALVSGGPPMQAPGAPAGG